MNDENINNTSSIIYKPIGFVRSAFQSVDGMPIQPSGNAAAPGVVEILPSFVEGLADLEGFSHIILLYHFHCSQNVQMTVTPFLDDESHGVFATRAPSRPNPIGLSVVKLLKREGNLLHIANLDILDNTPVLDVKPYVPEFDAAPATQIGWLESVQGKAKVKGADRRFEH